jgi:hypothetical protein
MLEIAFVLRDKHPIYLDDDLEHRAQEVHDELSDYLLSPKGDAQPLATNGRPQELLRVRGMMTHESGTFIQESASSGRRRMQS